MFSLLFFHDHVSLINWALLLKTFICSGVHQECVPKLRRSEYQTTRTTSLVGADNHWSGCTWSFVQLWQFCGIPGWALKEPIQVSVFLIDYLLTELLWGQLVWILSVKLTGVQTVLLSWVPVRETSSRNVSFSLGDCVHVLERSVCWWCMVRPNQMWSVGIGT